MTRSNSSMRQYNHLISEIDAVYHEAAFKLGVSDSALRILYILCEYENACPLRILYQYTGLTRQTLHSSLRNLQTQGFVSLQAINGRSKAACLTEAGRHYTARTAERLIALENRIFDAWPSQDLETYLSLTQRFAHALREGIEQL